MIPEAKVPRKKIQRWTRKKLYRQRQAVILATKRVEKNDKKSAVGAARRASRLEAAFVGCDPERIERLANG